MRNIIPAGEEPISIAVFQRAVKALPAGRVAQSTGRPVAPHEETR
jgi:hypothetical protein